MAHHIQAIVGSKPLLDSLQQRFGVSRVVELGQGLCLLPMLKEFYDALPGASPPPPPASDDEFHFRFLDSKLIALLLEASKIEPVAYVETEYFGGLGGQGAIAARDGRITFGPAEGDGSINAALRLLGANQATEHDEFSAVGLDRFRSNRDWINQPRYEPRNS